MPIVVNVGVCAGQFWHVPFKRHSEELRHIGDRWLYLLESHGEAESEERLKNMFVVKFDLSSVAETLLLTCLGVLVDYLWHIKGWNRRSVSEVQGYLSIIGEDMHALRATYNEIHYSCN